MKKLIRITTVPISLDKLLGKQLTFMNEFYEVTIVSANAKELQKVAVKYGVKNHHVEMTREISPFHDIIAVWKLYKFLKMEKPDIVHSHTPKAGIVGMMAAFLAGVPNRFHTVAGLPLLEATGTKRKILNFVEKLTYQLSTKIYPNSFVLQEIILQEGFCLEHKVKVLGNGSSNGIDTALFSKDKISDVIQNRLRSDLGINNIDFVFIFVGRLVGDKGINELVAAFSELQKDFTHGKLLLVGPLEAKLDALLPETLHEIKTNPSIITVGFQDDVRQFFAISDALVFPSYREGFPNVVLQAGSMGLPSIVTDINGCNEIVTSYKNGLIIPTKDVSTLKAAMIKFLSDRHLYRHLQQNSRRNITSRFEQCGVWEALLAEYKDIPGD